MNKTFRKLGGAFLFFAALSMTSCDIVGVPDNASGKYVVKINTEDMVLAPGETASRPSTDAAATTTYTSSDPAVATVDNAGLVKAVAEGTCVITVSTPFLATKTIEGDEILSTATAEYKVIVQPNLASALKEGAKIGFAFNLNGEDLEYLFQKQGDDYVLIPQNQPQSAPQRRIAAPQPEPQLIPALIYAKTTNTLTLTVSQQVGEQKSTVLTVIFNLNDNTIQIIPGNPLTKVLNFKVRIGNIEITAQLKKKEVAPTSVKFTVAATPFKMKVGEEITLDASVEPIDATDKAVTWTSSKPEVATVDANGKVTAKAAGETTIKVATSNGKFYEQALTVSAAVLNTYLKWNAGQKKLEETPIPTGTGVYVLSSGMSGTIHAGDANNTITFVIAGDVTLGTIELSGNVDLIIKDNATLTVDKIIGGNHNLKIYGQAGKSGELVVNCSDGIAISELSTLEVHSAKVTATSGLVGVFYNIGTFNVYGGLVDAKATGSKGFGIHLKANGSMNIYGGEVKAEGKESISYGITCGEGGNPRTVTVYGGKLWAGNANNKALNSGIDLTTGTGFTGKIYTSGDNESWDPLSPGAIPGTTKYVKVE